jgi:HPt (histidine-containing phosphotransfer) domain-containing protein
MALLPSNPLPGESLVDWPAFESEYDGQPGVVEKLVSTVLRTRSGDPERLRGAAEAGDLKTIGFLAHGLKTIGGLMKCSRLRDQARSTESAAAEVSVGAPPLAHELAGTLEQMLAELKSRLAAPPG